MNNCGRTCPARKGDNIFFSTNLRARRALPHIIIAAWKTMLLLLKKVNLKFNAELTTQLVSFNERIYIRGTKQKKTVTVQRSNQYEVNNIFLSWCAHGGKLRQPSAEPTSINSCKKQHHSARWKCKWVHPPRVVVPCLSAFSRIPSYVYANSHVARLYAKASRINGIDKIVLRNEPAARIRRALALAMKNDR